MFLNSVQDTIKMWETTDKIVNKILKVNNNYLGVDIHVSHGNGDRQERQVK